MRVAVVHNLQRGGARRRLAVHVAQMDAEVREFCLSTAAPLTSDPDLVPYSEQAERVHRLARPPVRYWDLAVLERAWRQVARRVDAWSPDVVYANPCQFQQAPGALAHLRAPSVYYCDEPRRVDYEPAARASTNPGTRGLYGPLRRWERHADRRALSACARLVTNSGSTARAIELAYGRSAQVLAPAIAQTFTPGAPTEPRHCLSVGTLIPSKGHDLAIEAVAASGLDLPLVVVAPRREDRELARLTSLAAERGVRLIVRFAITDEELIQAYRGALATLYLSRAEPLGLVSLESQACGTPVVVAAEGGLPSTVDDDVSGWAVPRDGAAAGARLRDLTPSRRLVMGAAALERADRWRRETGPAALDRLLADAAR